MLEIQPTNNKNNSADVSRISLNRCFLKEFSGGGPLNSFQVEGFSFFFSGGVGKLWYFCQVYMGVSKNRGTLKWMVYNGKFIKMEDLGVPLLLETPIYSLSQV